jgi:hypothetical protein
MLNYSQKNKKKNSGAAAAYAIARERGLDVTEAAKKGGAAGAKAGGKAAARAGENIGNITY